MTAQNNRQATILKLPVDEDKPSLLGECPEINRVRRRVESFANIAEAPVLLCGETGTGKEIVARLLHEKSDRRQARFVAVNCAAVPTHLWESVFFGHCKGAFTGATQNQQGYVEAAHKGTLFLDEINALPLEVQPKLLRFLENGVYTRVGETQERVSSARIIAASNQCLPDLIDQGAFRNDLYFRLNACEITLPPLRERGGDVILLAEYFIQRFTEQGAQPKTFSTAATTILQQYLWPGNVRELMHLVYTITKTVRAIRIEPRHFADKLKFDHEDNVHPKNKLVPLAAIEKEYIEKVLQYTNFNQRQTAKILKLHRNTLKRKIHSLGINFS